MTQQTPPPAPAPVPPQWSQAPPARQAAQSGWPIAVGVVSIILASLRFICVPIGLLGTHTAVKNPPAGAPAFPDWWLTYATLGAVPATLLGVLLLVAGIMLCRRRPAGRTAHVVWAPLELLWRVVDIVCVVQLMRFQRGSGPEHLGQQVGLLIGTLIAVAYPIFILIWMSRDRVRAEVAAWRAGGAPVNPYQSP